MDLAGRAKYAEFTWSSWSVPAELVRHCPLVGGAAREHRPRDARRTLGAIFHCRKTPAHPARWLGAEYPAGGRRVYPNRIKRRPQGCASFPRAIADFRSGLAPFED